MPDVSSSDAGRGLSPAEEFWIIAVLEVAKVGRSSGPQSVEELEIIHLVDGSHLLDNRTLEGPELSQRERAVTFTASVHSARRSALRALSR